MDTAGSRKYYYLFIFLILNASCIREAYNITGKAVLIDEETHAPISNSSILSQCYYQINIDESNFDMHRSKTDSLGIFSLEFDKGYKISMVIDADDYMKDTILYNPGRETMPDTIFMKRKISFESSVAKTKKADLSENKLGH